jgi:hypothetical protein
MFKARMAVLLLVLCSVALPQTKILLYDFEARNVDASVIRTCTQVLRDALNGTYKFVVIDPAPGTFCYNVVASAESAKVYGAGQALVGNIMSIGGKQFLTYQLVDATSSAVMLADKLELPPLEEFPTMAERIALSVSDKRPYSETVEPEKMTSPEAAPRFKHPRKPYAGLFLTAGYLFHMKQRPDTNALFKYSTNLVNLNMSVSFETQQMLTMLQLGLLRGIHSEQDLSFDMLGHYVVGNGDFAPFFGGGVGITRYSWSENNVTDHNDGLNLQVGAGVLGLRTYYFRLLAAAYGTYTISANDWGGVAGSKGVPGVRVMFGVSTPSLGPDATVKAHPACVSGAIGAFFLTGLIIALTS